MSELEWYPAELVDEACPPAKGSPAEFAFLDGGARWQLGYEPHDKRILDEDRLACNRAIAPGSVIEFVSCQRLGDIEATVHRDGTLALKGTVPGRYNVVIVNHDSDLLYQDLAEFVKAMKSPDQFCNPADYIFEDGAEQSADVTLSFADWSDPIPHLFEVVDGKPVFNPVPAQKQ
jgi:hypothetical protein